MLRWHTPEQRAQASFPFFQLTVSPDRIEVNNVPTLEYYNGYLLHRECPAKEEQTSKKWKMEQEKMNYMQKEACVSYEHSQFRFYHGQ